MEGKIKFFLENKGYGFVLDGTDPSKDYFFHVSGLLDKVEKDDKVQFDIEEGKRGLKAVNIKKIK